MNELTGAESVAVCLMESRTPEMGSLLYDVIEPLLPTMFSSRQKRLLYVGSRWIQEALGEQCVSVASSVSL